MPDTTLTPAEIAREVRRLADALFPGWVGAAQLRVKHPDGSTSVICGTAGTAAGLTERQQEILQVFDEASAGAVLTGPAVAKLVGCEYDSSFRADLSALRKAGRLSNDRPGYSLVG